jgi:hypothetical protein
LPAIARAEIFVICSLSGMALPILSGRGLCRHGARLGTRGSEDPLNRVVRDVVTEVVQPVTDAGLAPGRILVRRRFRTKKWAHVLTSTSRTNSPPADAASLDRGSCKRSRTHRRLPSVAHPGPGAGTGGSCLRRGGHAARISEPPPSWKERRYARICPRPVARSTRNEHAWGSAARTRFRIRIRAYRCRPNNARRHGAASECPRGDGGHIAVRIVGASPAGALNDLEIFEKHPFQGLPWNAPQLRRSRRSARRANLPSTCQRASCGCHAQLTRTGGYRSARPQLRSCDRSAALSYDSGAHRALGWHGVLDLRPGHAQGCGRSKRARPIGVVP